MAEIQISLEVKGEHVGSGVFEVVPRVGERVHVRIHAPKGGRSITGTVEAVEHGSSVTIDEDGNLAEVSSMVGLALFNASVEPL